MKRERVADTLFRWRRPRCAWHAAGPPSAHAVGLLYTPDAVIPIRSEDAGWRCVEGEIGDAGAFEARIWNDQWDLRWVEDEPGSGVGTATVISEEHEIGLVGERPDELSVEATFDHQYLVWGVVDRVDRGWVTTSTPRVGAITVPAPGAAPGDRLLLDAREYLGVTRAHGLCGPVGERLIGFRSVSGHYGAGDSGARGGDR